MSDVPSSPAVHPAAGVLLYDGKCGLCNACVRALLRADRAGRLRFSPLQGPAAQRFLRIHGLNTENFDSLVWAENLDDPTAPFWLRTEALVQIAQRLPAPWRWLSYGRYVPRVLRDAVYRLVARLRYAVLGPYRPRPLDNPSWAERFVDPPM